LEPDKSFARGNGDVFGSFHVFSPIMSVGGHVVVDIYEFGGVRVAVGDHVKMKMIVRGCDWNWEALVSQWDWIEFK